jgi:hypothetical protein
MDVTVDRKKDNRVSTANIGLDEYRENVRKLMLDEVRKVIDEEIQKAAQELLEEQRKAISCRRRKEIDLGKS